MGVSYFKRYRMQRPLHDAFLPQPAPLPAGYYALRWHPNLIEAHAEAKYRSFCDELDANVFPCLGQYTGCLRLMEDISRKTGFRPAATWLLAFRRPGTRHWDYCGTIQGIADQEGCGNIQNIGIAPEHRGRGLGTHLLLRSLHGFRQGGLTHASLEVTVRNAGAVRLYERTGFRRVKTVYKAVAVAYS